jgi:hypothetical protein
MALESIEIDATDICPRINQPYAVESFSTVKRGTNKSQSYVYPEMWQTGGKAKSNMPVGVLTDLSLEGVSYTHRPRS